MNFDALVKAIAEAHRLTQSSAARAVNTALTLRNWFVGAHIVEFEQHGEDRAAYGEELLAKLAERLRNRSVPRCDERELRRFRQFYLAYPQIRETVPPELAGPLCLPEKRETASPEFGFQGSLLLERLSFSHLALLSEIDNRLKRAFYEAECLKGNWSVRELKRQIGSLYFERSGLSMDNRLFVSKYQLELPRTEELQRYLDEQRRLLGGA